VQHTLNYTWVTPAICLRTLCRDRLPCKNTSSSCGVHLRRRWCVRSLSFSWSTAPAVQQAEVVSSVWSPMTPALHTNTHICRNGDVETAAYSSLSSASPPNAHPSLVFLTSVRSATSPQQRQCSQWCRRVHGALLNTCKWLCNALPVFQ